MAAPLKATSGCGWACREEDVEGCGASLEATGQFEGHGGTSLLLSLQRIIQKAGQPRRAWARVWSQTGSAPETRPGRSVNEPPSVEARVFQTLGVEDGEVLEDGPRLLRGMFCLEVRLRSAPWALQGERRSCLRAVVRPVQAGHAPVRGRQGAGSGQVPEAGDGELLMAAAQGPREGQDPRPEVARLCCVRDPQALGPRCPQTCRLPCICMSLPRAPCPLSCCHNSTPQPHLPHLPLFPPRALSQNGSVPVPSR